MIRLEESRPSSTDKYKVCLLYTSDAADEDPNMAKSKMKIEEINNKIYIYPGILAELYKGVDIIEKYGLMKYGNTLR